MQCLVLDKIAWVLVDGEGHVLTARNRGVDVFYFPGGHREAGESDVETLVREVAEELSVTVVADTIHHFGTYEIPDSGGGIARMTCYFADYRGPLTTANEIDEMRWMAYTDRNLVSPLDQMVFDALKAAGQL